MASPAIDRAATLSDCGTWRYDLTRRWAAGPSVMWVLLNPSRADATRDDQTVRRVMAFSRQAGFAAAVVVNLYALRATNPAELAGHHDPIGPDTDRFLAAHAANHGVAIVGWGATSAFPGRAGRRRHEERIDAVQAALVHLDLCCLGRTCTGKPRHPSRLGDGRTLTAWDALPRPAE